MMKKIITISTAVALFGAALLFVGCTKDYGQDLTDVKKDIEELDGRTTEAEKDIDELESKVAALEKAKTELEAADKALGDKITALDNNKADKTALENVRKDLQGKIDLINTTINDLKAAIALKADKTYVDATFAKQTYVDATFATIDALKDVEKTVGNLKKSVETLEEAVFGGTEYKGILERLNAVEKAIEELPNTYYNKTEINDFFKLYYKKGEIDAMVSALKYSDTLFNAAMIDSVTAVRNDLNVKIAEVEGKLNDEIERSMNEDSFLKAWIDTVNETSLRRDNLICDVIDSLKAATSDSLQNHAKALGRLFTLVKAERLQREKDVAALKEADSTNKAELSEQIIAANGRIKELSDSLVAEIERVDTLSANIYEKVNKENKAIWDYLNDEETGPIGPAVAKLQKEVKALQDNYEALDTTLKAMMKIVNGKIDALSSRVASISVCPTLNEELVTFTLGSNDMKMLRATFAVAPVDAVDNMIENKDSLTLIYAEGIARGNTKASVIYKKAKILKVIKDEPYGTLTVIADSVFTSSTGTKAMPTAVYFALAWGDYDAAGKARICSDFAQAIEHEGAFDLLKGFKYAYNKDTVNIKFVPKDDFVNESTRDFVQAETDSVAPFNDKMVAYDNSGADDLERLFLLEDYYTVYKLGKILNHEFEVTAKKDYKTPPVCAYSAKGYGTFDIKFTFQAGKGEKLSQYVNKNPWTIDFQAKVDGHNLIDAQEEPSYLTHNAYITPVDRGTYDLGTVNIDWNYETYKAEDRDTVITPSIPQWQAAKDAKCKVMKQLGNSDLLNYADWNDNDSTKCYDPIKLSLNANEYEGEPFDAVKDTVYKQCDTVKYQFAFETTADTPQGDIYEKLTENIPGSLTLAREVVVKDFYKKILAKNPEAAKTPAKDIFIHGAKDTTYDSVLKAAQAKIEEKNCVLTVDGSTNIMKFTYQYNSSKDEMTFTIIAGHWKYSKTGNINFKVVDVFGFKYVTEIVVNIGAPKFGLGTKNWIVKTEKGLLGTARGAIVGGLYTLEDMYYNKQVEVVNLDSLNKYETVAEGDLTVKFDTVTLKNLYPKADGKIGVEAGKTGVTVNPKDGSLSSDILTWGDYNGRMFKLKAQLYLKKDKVGEPLEYYICTDKPVTYVSNNDINKQRTPKVDLPIKLYENAVVYGVVDGKTVEQNIVKPDGTISKYMNTYFEYADPEDWKVTLNGSTPTSWIENVDYKYDTDKQILTIMGDNLKGELKIVIGTKLHYYLDANVPEEKDLTINISQN